MRYYEIAVKYGGPWRSQGDYTSLGRAQQAYARILKGLIEDGQKFEIRLGMRSATTIKSYKK